MTAGGRQRDGETAIGPPASGRSGQRHARRRNVQIDQDRGVVRRFARQGAGPATGDAAREAAPRPLVVAVTVLTSLDDNDLARVGQNGPAADQVVRLASLAKASGLDGVVCSAHEAGVLRKALGPDFRLIVPGIRPAGSAVGDQKRVMDPKQAIEAGADFLVVGRPITEAADPATAARAIVADILAAGK